MTPEDTGKLVAYVVGACPQQQVNDLTPYAWHDILGHLEYAECRDAVRAVAARQPFVAPSEIIREVADKRSVHQPHSNACRDGDCASCRVSWCCCSCHPEAVAAIAGPPPAPRPSPQLRGGQPRQLGMGDLPGRPS